MNYKYESSLQKDQYLFKVRTNDSRIIDDLKINISFDKLDSRKQVSEVIYINFNDLSSVPNFVKEELKSGKTILIHGGTTEQQVYGIKCQKEDLIIFYIPKNNEYIIKSGNCFVLYGANNGREKNLYRIVREIYYRKGLSLGRIAIHSASICDNHNNGILITGDKAKGKTSMLFNFLIDGYKFVDNDRILLELKDNNLIAYSMSSTVNVGYGSMSIIPEKFSNMDIASKNSQEKQKYTKEEFIKQLGCDFSNSTIIKSVVFPNVDKSNTDSIIRITGKDKCERIISSLEKFNNDEHPDWLGISNVNEKTYNLYITKIMLFISTYIPTYEINFGYKKVDSKILKLVKDDLK